jgi:hypothetical protein
MVITERRVGGFLRYRKVWFPKREAALQISQSMRPNDVVRLFAASSDLGTLRGLVRHRQGLTAFLDLSGGPEAVLKGMKKKSCRYEIRRAEKMLDRVRIEINSSRACRDFLTLYNDFAKAKGLPKLPASWFREYVTHGEALVLYLEEEPLCCHLLLCDPDGGTVRLVFSGSRRLETPGEAAACGALNRYLHWHEIQRYHAQGIVNFDFGGIRSSEDPISRFKLSFGAVVVPEHYYLLGGTLWVARLGNLIYERILRRRAFASKANSSGLGVAAEELVGPRDDAE